MAMGRGALQRDPALPAPLPVPLPRASLSRRHPLDVQWSECPTRVVPTEPGTLGLLSQDRFHILQECLELLAPSGATFTQSFTANAPPQRVERSVRVPESMTVPRLVPRAPATLASPAPE
jgi:hypothetical protein